MHCSRRLIVQTLVFSRSYLHHQVSPPETLVVKGGTTWARNGRLILPENARLPRKIQRSFTCRKSTTWDKWLYFPSERRRAEDFFALKNPTASAGFEPANLGTKGQHATSRPPKPLLCQLVQCTVCSVVSATAVQLFSHKTSCCCLQEVGDSNIALKIKFWLRFFFQWFFSGSWSKSLSILQWGTLRCCCFCTDRPAILWLSEHPRTFGNRQQPKRGAENDGFARMWSWYWEKVSWKLKKRCLFYILIIEN